MKLSIKVALFFLALNAPFSIWTSCGGMGCTEPAWIMPRHMSWFDYSFVIGGTIFAVGYVVLRIHPSKYAAGTRYTWLIFITAILLMILNVYQIYKMIYPANL